MLAALGLSTQEERLYQAVLEQPRASVTTYSSTLSIAQHQVSDLLASLELRGLVSRSGSRPPRYTAADPRVALGLLMLRRQEELEQHRQELELAREAIEQLGDRFTVSAQRVSSHDLIEIVTGQEIVIQRMNQALGRAEREIIAFGKAPGRDPPEDFTRLKLGLLTRGVRCRGVYERQALEAPGLLSFLERVAEAGEQSRVVSELPMRLTVIDRRFAYTPLELDRWDEWLLVQSVPLINALVTVFETIWKAASPLPLQGNLPPATPHERPPVRTKEDQRVLALLASGMQDDAVARQMGLSVRSVARRVSQIMDEFSATTRFQAGWLARGAGAATEAD